MRYSQVDEHEVEWFGQTIPDTFIIRAGCAAIDDKNAENKRVIAVKKEAVRNLIQQQSGVQSDSSSQRQPLGDLISLAAAVGVDAAALAAATELTEDKLFSIIAKEPADKKRKQARGAEGTPPQRKRVL